MSNGSQEGGGGSPREGDYPLFKYFDELAKFIQARRAFADVNSRAKKPA